MARRSDHSREELHQLALQAAESIVSAQGYKALSARKVATKIGYTVGTLYQMFTNLEALSLEINGRTLDELHIWLSQQIQGEARGKNTLHILASAYIDFAMQHLHRWNMLFEYVADEKNEQPEWYLLKISRMFQLIEENLPAIDQSKTNYTDEQLSRVLWASVHGICLLKIRQGLELSGGLSTKEMTDILIDNFLNGLES